MHSSQYHSNEVDDNMIEKKAQECVEYILFCCLAERKSFVRKSDLNKNIIKDNSRSFKHIIKQTGKYLANVFGLELIDIDNDKGDRFGIRSKFEHDSALNKLTINECKKGLTQFNNDSSNSDSDPEFQEQLKYSILMISLSLIFMNENEIDSNLFWDSLKKIDINKDEKRHKYLGDVFKYFTSDLVRDGYLEYEQIKGIDPPAFKFKWGYRAKLEITKISVLNFVCELYGGADNCKPEEWIAQYSDAIKQDEFNRDVEINDENSQNITLEASQTQNRMSTHRSRNTDNELYQSQSTQRLRR